MKNKEEEEEESLYYRIWETKLLALLFLNFSFSKERASC